MKKIFLLLLILIGVSFGATKTTVYNWNGWLDTVSVTDVLDSATVYYTKAFRLSDGEDCRVQCFADDTAETGFAADSVNFEWGYQTGSIVLNKSNAKDTAWDDRMSLSTIVVDSFGVENEGAVDATGALTRYLGGVDTLSVTGYASQSRWIVPEWDIIWRFWVKSLGGAQKKGAPLNLRFNVSRREFSQVRTK